MLIKRLNSGSTTRSALVTLQNDKERALTKTELMLIVDNARGIRFDPRTDSYHLVDDDFGPERFQGGRVEDTPNPDVKLVAVYID